MINFKFTASVILGILVLVTIAAGSNNIPVSGSVNNTSSAGAQVQNLATIKDPRIYASGRRNYTR